NDQVVGKLAASSSDINTLSSAFIWEAGQIRDLNGMLAPGSGWILRDANAINDAGAIVGVGFLQNQRHSFLLNPLPEPSALVMLFFSSSAMAARRFPTRRRDRLASKANGANAPTKT